MPEMEDGTVCIMQSTEIPSFHYKILFNPLFNINIRKLAIIQDFSISLPFIITCAVAMR
jgi:hypothetical protein